MNKRFLGVLIFAFVVATCGGVMTYRLLINRAPAASAAPPSIRIAVATRTLDAGAMVKEADLKLADWQGAPPPGASSHLQDFVGRGVLTKIYSNEPMIETRLAPKGAGAGLAAMIPQGMRAFAVRVNEVVGVAGFVTPGMRVDVLINGNAPGADNSLGTLARTVMQNIEVLSAGQDIRKDSEGKPIVTQVVTLLVTPDQAETLSLAVNQTTIQLVLRNPIDRQVAKAPGTALAYLFSKGAPRPAPVAAKPAVARPVVREIETPKAAPPHTIEIIMGTRKTETKFDGNGEGK